MRRADADQLKERRIVKARRCISLNVSIFSIRPLSYSILLFDIRGSQTNSDGIKDSKPTSAFAALAQFAVKKPSEPIKIGLDDDVFKRKMRVLNDTFLQFMEKNINAHWKDGLQV